MLSDSCSEFCDAMGSIEDRPRAYEELLLEIDHYTSDDYKDDYEPDMIAYLRSHAEMSPFKAYVAATLVRYYLNLAPDISPGSWAAFVKEYLP
jgi:hypothetical protein